MLLLQLSVMERNPKIWHRMGSAIGDSPSMCVWVRWVVVCGGVGYRIVRVRWNGVVGGGGDWDVAWKLGLGF